MQILLKRLTCSKTYVPPWTTTTTTPTTIKVLGAEGRQPASQGASQAQQSTSEGEATRQAKSC